MEGAFYGLILCWHGCCCRNFSQAKGESTCISTGIYGYPKEEAAKIAVREVRGFCLTRRRDAPAPQASGCLSEANPKGRKGPRDAECAEEMEIIFCCFSERDNQVYEQVLENLK